MFFTWLYIIEMLCYNLLLFVNKQLTNYVLYFGNPTNNKKSKSDSNARRPMFIFCVFCLNALCRKFWFKLYRNFIKNTFLKRNYPNNLVIQIHWWGYSDNALLLI